MRRSVILTLVLMGITPGAQVQAQAVSPAGMANLLVDQLGAARYRDRESAGDELRRLGVSGLDALRRGQQSPDLEIAKRSALLLSQIDHDSLAQSLSRPQTISLAYVDTPIAEILSDLERRTGIAFQMAGSSEAAHRRITIQTQSLPLWAAIETFLNAADLQEIDAPTWLTSPAAQSMFAAPSTISPIGSSPRIVLTTGRTTTRLPQDSLSPLRVRLTNPQSGNRTIHFDGQSIALNLDILTSPTPICREILGVRILRCRDDQGRVISPTETLFEPSGSEPMTMDPPTIGIGGGGVVAFRPIWPSSPSLPSQPMLPRSVPITLRLPFETPHSIRRLEGVTLVRMQTWLMPLGVITLAPTGEPLDELRTEQRSLRILNVQRNGTQIHVRARLQTAPDRIGTTSRSLAPGMRMRGNLQPLMFMTEPTMASSETPRLDLQDDHDQTMSCISESVTVHEGANGTQTQDWQLVYQLPSLDRVPTKFTLTGRRTVLVEIPFTLTDLPIR